MRPHAGRADHCGFATRYDKLAVRYEATVQVSDIDIRLRNLSIRA